ncbi:hypothetical protein LTR08_000960 [Meristemomyces frigidus]|nr:hypothetical protein LTR08_000960 [Meristemomyces frigidus]
MDIRQWLEETADHALPDQDADLGLPAFLQPHPEPEQPARKYRRKRKQPSADSSIIELQHPQHARHTAANHAPSSNEARDADDAVTKPRSWRSSQSCVSGDVPRKAYEKRARHKTRLDRYEPKSKERREERKERKEREAREERKSRPKRRKSHRSGDGGRTSGMVQSFQLKNGPKNNRLTLKPEATAGLFKHGRASAQAVGRGGGLPDLVFNEMRFLQRPKDHQDELPNDGDARPTTKNDRKKEHEEDISAYFAAQNLTAQQDNEGRAVQGAQSARLPTHQTRPQSRRAEERVADPPVDLPDKPFLGFGSRGVHLESKDTQIASNSNYTWSDSAAPQTKVTAVQDGINRAAIQREPLLSSPKRKRRFKDDHPADQIIFERHTPGLDNVVEGGNWLQSRRTRGPALVEVYQPPAVPAHVMHRRRRSVTKTTLQSLPRLPSSEPPDHVPKRADGIDRRQRSVSYRTSDILDVHDQLRSKTRVRQHRHQDQHEDQHEDRHVYQHVDQHVGSPALHEKENRDPDSSTPTSKLLRRAQQAVEHPRSPAAPVRSHIPEDTLPTPIGHSFSHEDHEQSTAPKARTPRDVGPKAGLRERRLESASGLRHRQAPIPAPPLEAQWRRRVPQPPQIHHHHAIHPVVYEEDEMLDNQHDLAAYGIEDPPVYATARQAEKLVHELRSDRTSGLHEAQQSEHVFSESLRSRLSVSNLSAGYLPATTPPIRGMSTERDFRSEQSAIVAESVVIGALDEFAGFWKPHVLY